MTNQTIKQPNHLSAQSGFTLIELMTVVMIIGIFAAIAVPSYRQFIVRNAESETQAKMQQMAIELRKWRASALSYRNFHPSSCSTGTKTNCYDANNTNIYIPLGSTARTYRYRIVLTDYTTPSQSLVPTTDANNPTASNVAIGRDWMMVAEPNPNSSSMTTASVIYFDSRDVRCKAIKSTLTIAQAQMDKNCSSSSNAQTW